MISVGLGHLPSPLLLLMFVQAILCLHVYSLCSVVVVCLCFIFLETLRAVHWVEFDQLILLTYRNHSSLHLKICLTELVVWFPNVYLISYACHALYSVKYSERQAIVRSRGGVGRTSQSLVD